MYLSKLFIKNFRGIKTLNLDFHPTINIIIGENGSFKSAVIDSIRLLYNIGEPAREISVSFDDFHESIEIDEDGRTSLVKENQIEISYEFKGLTTGQKGAFYEYMVIDPVDPNSDYAKITIRYENNGGKYPHFSYFTGAIEGQRADYMTFELFQHYYLGALRDSTRDLLMTRGNIMGKVIRKHVKRNETEGNIEQIMRNANNELLNQQEVINTRSGVNENLAEIFKQIPQNFVGLRIEEARTEFIVNAIKPFLPHDNINLTGDGFHLWQNSLGYNNLIYTATVLGDIKEQMVDDNLPHYALLIEEPEAHLHPQLQLNLFNFLQKANSTVKSQLFITSHSPTLTSKVPLENLILLDKGAFRINDVFEGRVMENIVEDTVLAVTASQDDITFRKKQLERYVDVTKSQLFYARSILFVEGISEELLISAFTELENYRLEDYGIEMVNVKGTSFYPFLYLFNSSQNEKCINKKITVLTDDDRYANSKSKDYSFKRLIENGYSVLDTLDTNIQSGVPSVRIANLNSVANGKSNIEVKHAFKTLEFELALANINQDRTTLGQNFLFAFLQNAERNKIQSIIDYANTFPNDVMSTIERRKVALLLWKVIKSKAEFAQDFSIHILNNLVSARGSFNIPAYITSGLDHLK